MNTTAFFKTLCSLGLLLLFFSLFLDMYSFQVYNGKELIADWSYNIFTGWHSSSELGTLNELLEPQDLQVPLILNILLIATIFSSLYILILKPIEKDETLQNSSVKVYPLTFALILNAYCIFVFPIFYLFPNEYYFPFVLIEHENTDLVFSYSIGPGYIVQLVSFALIFPYVLFSIQTLRKFKTDQASMRNLVQQHEKITQKPIDFEKLIAEEHLDAKFSPEKSHLREISQEKLTIKKRRIR